MYTIYYEMKKNRKNGKNFENDNLMLDNNSIEDIIIEKITFLQNIIRNTILSINNNKFKKIFSNNDAILSISILTDLYESTEILANNSKTITSKNGGDTNSRNSFITVSEKNKKLDCLQQITDKLIMVVCGFGTLNMTELIHLVFGFNNKFTELDNPIIKSKVDLIINHIQPIGCKIVQWKPHKIYNNNYEIVTDKITDEITNIENACSYECYDLNNSTKSFYQKIFGIRVVIHNPSAKKTVIVNGLVNDIQLECFTNEYIKFRKNDITLVANDLDSIEKDILLRLLESLSLKDILIYGTKDLQKKMMACLTEVNNVKQTKLDITIKKFTELEDYSKRDMLINLLLYNNDDEIKYLCYILYDLVSTDRYDGGEQQSIVETLPSNIKRTFKDVVKYTAKYTNDMMQKYDIHKITLEQQIYLMKANEIVKEKAIAKLKEVKSRSDETGLKAKQYLEGLLKIPFNVYREEPILKKMKEINRNYIKIAQTIENIFGNVLTDNKNKKEKYSLLEIIDNINKLETYLNENLLNAINNTISILPNKQVLNTVYHINTIKKSKKQQKILTSNKSKDSLVKSINVFLNENRDDYYLLTDIFDLIHTDIPQSLNKSIDDISSIKKNVSHLENAIVSVENILDDSIHSHDYAKKQIIKTIAQWMNGEQSGYCFGFEGCPGIGKTSLAKKGLSNCLKDDNGNPRPFAFIALGGSSNGSLLDGHGYTYMNSTWGKIVDILIDTKCMNPIIYIDELDKVSKTENGKEIIGIFTHLIDQTQNDKFQDKYFSGIDIDLSKALFIFSYNDPDQIDRILLDRIHRIKFDNLTVTDKIVICNKFILPEINKKMGFEDIVQISDKTIEYIINNYTLEPGVRKLKEIFFDLFGEINLKLLKSNFGSTLQFPICISESDIDTKYLTKYNKINEKRIGSKSEIGIINGLWANSLGRGGIIPIQTTFYPSATFLELKLTGLQGDVMKESMNVAKTLAWNLTQNETKRRWINIFDDTKEQGIHIHCPEGSISKDGPSAGAAITAALYSLFNNRLIKNNYAITGEICLNGDITAIGGLEDKITGGIRAGVKTFLYPKSNNKEFNEWKKKDNNGDKYGDISFIEVANISDVFAHIFEPDNIQNTICNSN